MPHSDSVRRQRPARARNVGGPPASAGKLVRDTLPMWK
jgi:hypothetical protein